MADIAAGIFLRLLRYLGSQTVTGKEHSGLAHG